MVHNKTQDTYCDRTENRITIDIYLHSYSSYIYLYLQCIHLILYNDLLFCQVYFDFDDHNSRVKVTINNNNN